MAGVIASDIKDLITINIKHRHDDLSDQYNRVFMVKLCLVSSLIMSVSWFKDSIKCIVPEDHGFGEEAPFVSAACWIQGVYVYKELINKFDIVAYYAMPKNMDNDGMIRGTEDLCSTVPKLEAKPPKNCIPMTKMFFLQYQYMPFYIGALTLLYFLPYIAYQACNKDMIALRDHIKEESPDSNKVTETFFDHKVTSRRQLNTRVCLNILVKVIYIGTNLICFLGLNNILNGQFINYGVAWTKWSFLDNEIAYDYMGRRDFPKPGNRLLPPFGYCEVYESSRDIKITLANKHKFVCEMSQNILYQYVLLVLWYGIVIGIVISIYGFILLLLNYLISILSAKSYGTTQTRLRKELTLREIEYLEYIRKKNLTLYHDVFAKIKDNVLGPNNNNDGYPLEEISDNAPLYPNLTGKST